jgi:2-(1,2-epoxy-1,2-dihydrophenyl)acetyl-CoA isomerase
MDDAPILVELRDGYRVITLNRPQRLNACTEAMLTALNAALAEADADRGCRALLLTGAGRAFCTGQDLADRLAKPDEKAVGGAQEYFYNPLIRKLRALPFPIVAAGAGANIALACDVVLAARSASFIQSFAKIGLIPDSGGTWTLPRLIGPARARALMLLAEPLPADKAEAWGMIWRTVDDATLMTEAEKLCTHFASTPPEALASIKVALDAAWSNDLSTQLDLERNLQHAASLTADYAEGVRAFAEKRAPQFTGRKK